MNETIGGDGSGPGTMLPRVQNLILAASDSVAIDAIAAQLRGFEPLSIPFLSRAHVRSLRAADPRQIELVGDDVSLAKPPVSRPDSNVCSFTPSHGRVDARLPIVGYQRMSWYTFEETGAPTMKTELGELFRKH